MATNPDRDHVVGCANVLDRKKVIFNRILSILSRERVTNSASVANMLGVSNQEVMNCVEELNVFCRNALQLNPVRNLGPLQHTKASRNFFNFDHSVLKSGSAGIDLTIYEETLSPEFVEEALRSKWIEKRFVAGKHQVFPGVKMDDYATAARSLVKFSSNSKLSEKEREMLVDNHLMRAEWDHSYLLLSKGPQFLEGSHKVKHLFK